MTNGMIERLRDEALNLPQAERVELACKLVQSLADPDAAQVRSPETIPRLAGCASENTQIISRAEFIRYMREQIDQP
ncbi:MAG: hypothetical protein E4H01_04645 [Lysobacterales bacterium]|nr:MAG: hypothetical protein E4H01_04645 [Xanthomonadales bacterium]